MGEDDPKAIAEAIRKNMGVLNSLHLRTIDTLSKNDELPNQNPLLDFYKKSSGSKEALAFDQIPVSAAKMLHVLAPNLLSLLTGVSGSELAKRLVASRPDIQVLYMSGYAGKVLATQDLAVSPGPLIEKPFTKETLLQQLRMVIRERNHYR
jgi:CheY-like chemotaxis protein